MTPRLDTTFLFEPTVSFGHTLHTTQASDAADSHESAQECHLLSRCASMCTLALIGAEVEAGRLLSLFNGPNNELDATLEGEASLVEWFPASHSVVRVTLGGCSCALLRGLGQQSVAASTEAHVAGPGYAFRRSIAAAAVAYGGIRLMIRTPGHRPVHRLRVASLGQFLRFGLVPNDGLIAIAP